MMQWKNPESKRQKRLGGIVTKIAVGKDERKTTMLSLGHTKIARVGIGHIREIQIIVWVTRSHRQSHCGWVYPA